MTALVAVASPAMADTIYDAGTPSGASGQVIFQPALTNYTYGALFSVANQTSLTNIGGIFQSTTNAATITATIALANGTMPGASLFSTTFGAPQSNSPTYYYGTFGSNTLAAGNYFALFSGNITSGNISDTLSINIAAPSPLVTEVQRNNDNTSGYQNTNAGYAFRIEGNPTGVGVTPEPDTWTMMILGFGLIGAALRRRNRVPALYA